MRASFITDATDWITGDAVDWVTGAYDTVVDAIGDAFDWLLTPIYWCLYHLVVGACWLVDLCYEFFKVFSGLTKIKYGNKPSYLINVFFSDTLITNIYWQMAIIGMVLCVGFAIFAIAKKMFDADQRQQHSLGMILGNTFKGIMVMASMSLVIQITLQASGVLMEQINQVFTNAPNEAGAAAITFTDKQFATMARVLNTIGNYSLNPSYNSTYNINSCYNALRGDLTELSNEKVFAFHYKPVKGEEGNTIVTWQYMLQKLVVAADSRVDLPMDSPNETVSNAIVSIMNEMRYDGQFAPLQKYEEKYPANDMPWGAMIFLLGTLEAAHNPAYNADPNFDDAVRGPYYRGEKDYQDYDVVTEDFSVSIGTYNYVLVFITIYFQIVPFLAICIAFLYRIFNMLMLYIVSPFMVSTLPLDDGAKFKQWTVSFIIQTFGAFSGMIAMQLFYVCATILFRGKLVLFENSMFNMIGKMMVLMGFLYALRKINDLITGILADNAGGAAIAAANGADSVAALEGWKDKTKRERKERKTDKQNKKDRKERDKEKAEQRAEKLEQQKVKKAADGGASGKTNTESGSGGSGDAGQKTDTLNQTNLNKEKSAESKVGADSKAAGAGADTKSALGKEVQAAGGQKAGEGKKITPEQHAHLFGTGKKSSADKEAKAVGGEKAGGGKKLTPEQHARMFGTGKKPSLNKEVKPVAGQKVGGGSKHSPEQLARIFGTGKKASADKDTKAVGGQKVGEAGQKSVNDKKIAAQAKMFGVAPSSIKKRIIGSDPTAIPNKRPPVQ